MSETEQTPDRSSDESTIGRADTQTRLRAAASGDKANAPMLRAQTESLPPGHVMQPQRASQLQPKAVAPVAALQRLLDDAATAQSAALSVWFWATIVGLGVAGAIIEDQKLGEWAHNHPELASVPFLVFVAISIACGVQVWAAMRKARELREIVLDCVTHQLREQRLLAAETEEPPLSRPATTPPPPSAATNS